MFESGTPDTCAGANGGFKHTAPFMEVALVNRGTDDTVAERMLTPKGDQNAPQTAALCHAIVTLAGKSATCERPGDKLREGVSGGRQRARRRLG